MYSYAAMRNLKCHFCRFTTTVVTKTYIEIHLFLLDVIHISDMYYHNKLVLTQQKLPVRCEFCCEFFIFQRKRCVSSMRAHSLHVSVSHFRLLI